MVYIKKIDLRGFKTFSRKVTLKLDQGLTVITGPNGSGKSNILDSLRFALGELSPKELRGASLSDLISKSTIQNPPRSVYVSIQFDNADRRLPIDSGSITISREFYKGGEGIYRLNGRRVSRKQLTELLSSADINVSGYNIVPQHAITRLAEVTSEERRKIVEDLVGLGIYDLKKEEAKIQLSQADTNLKIASARVDEVRLRVESLQKERNDFLRHSLLTKEIARLQAQSISIKKSNLKKDLETIREQAETKESQLTNLRKERDRLSTSKVQLEQELRSLEEKLLDRGGQKINELERYLGEINSYVGSYSADIDAKKLNLQLLRKQKDDLAQSEMQSKGEVENQKTELVKLKSDAEDIQVILNEKEPMLLELSNQVQIVRQGQTETSKILDDLEEELKSLAIEKAEVSSKIEAESAKIDTFEDQLTAFQNRETELQRALKDLQKNKDDIESIKKSQEERFVQIDNSANKYLTIREQKENSLKDAVKIIESVYESILEFDSQNKLFDKLAPKEVALKEIDELQTEGILHNFVGRLRDLLFFDKKYEKAVYAACTDWLDSIVVKDVASAIMCIEYLKQHKLGRIKILPLDMISANYPITEIPEIEGIISRIVDCVKYDDSIKPAIDFILGDTLIANSQRSAYLSSLKGFRTVVTTGDLYEPSGALEGGYYREPLDISSIAPRTKILSDLKDLTSSLSKLIGRDRLNLEKLQSNIDQLKDERISLQKSLDRAHNDFEIIKEKLQYISEELANIDNQKSPLNTHIQRTRESIQFLINKKSELDKKFGVLEEKRNSLRNKIKTDDLKKTEEKFASIREELDAFRNKKSVLDLKISNFEASIKNNSQALEHVKNQLSYVQDAEREIMLKLELATKALQEWKNKLTEVTLERENLSRSLESLKQNRTQTQTELDQLNETSQKIELEIEPLTSNLTMLRLELNKKELEENYLMDELGRLGFGSPIETYALNLKVIEENLATLKVELQEIGAINELAVTHYEEQKNNYKQLSIRINQLEKEKQSILHFMEELEQKKRDTFISVFERLNHNFNDVFLKITDGGTGKLVLENPDDIFSGGVDMQLAFPGKAELSIGSASGGEKSVATVCFLLALQAIHPMPFYVFDEIDAHLDMVNSQRLADLLRERSINSQFIVVSLKDITISRAAGVFGIFIQDGHSQVVSLPKPEGQSNDRS